ncbi:hypothetical protein TCSYLVIO_001959 [Trypanosoma cruzi]|nr:hypothetical protein TCSYLVIO_001959 [Trypanosoma cruzi]
MSAGKGGGEMRESPAGKEMHSVGSSIEFQVCTGSKASSRANSDSGGDAPSLREEVCGSGVVSGVHGSPPASSGPTDRRHVAAAVEGVRCAMTQERDDDKNGHARPHQSAPALLLPLPRGAASTMEGAVAQSTSPGRLSCPTATVGRTARDDFSSLNSATGRGEQRGRSDPRGEEKKARIHAKVAPVSAATPSHGRLIDDKSGGCWANCGPKVRFPFFESFRGMFSSNKRKKSQQHQEGIAREANASKGASAGGMATAIVPMDESRFTSFTTPTPSPPVAAVFRASDEEGRGKGILDGYRVHNEDWARESHGNGQDVEKDPRQQRSHDIRAPPHSMQDEKLQEEDVSKAREAKEVNEVTDGGGSEAVKEVVENVSRSVQASPLPAASAPLVTLVPPVGTDFYARSSASTPRTHEEEETSGALTPKLCDDIYSTKDENSLYFEFEEEKEEANADSNDSQFASSHSLPFANLEVKALPSAEKATTSSTTTMLTEEVVPNWLPVVPRRSARDAFRGLATSSAKRTHSFTRAAQRGHERSANGNYNASHETSHVTIASYPCRSHCAYESTRRMQNGKKKPEEGGELGDDERMAMMMMRAVTSKSYASLLPPTCRTAIKFGSQRNGKQPKENNKAVNARQVSAVRWYTSTPQARKRAAAVLKSRRDEKSTGHSLQQRVNSRDDDNSWTKEDSVHLSLGSYAQMAARRREYMEYMQKSKSLATSHSIINNSRSSAWKNKKHLHGGKATCPVLREPTSGIDFPKKLLREGYAEYWRYLAALLMQNGNKKAGHTDASMARLFGTLKSRRSPYTGLTWREFKSLFYLSNSFSMNTNSSFPLHAGGTEPTTEMQEDPFLVLSMLIRPSCAACGPDARELQMLYLLSNGGRERIVTQPAREWLYESVPTVPKPKFSTITPKKQPHTLESSGKKNNASVEKGTPSGSPFSYASQFSTTAHGARCSDNTLDRDSSYIAVKSDAVEPKQHEAQRRRGFNDNENHDVSGALPFTNSSDFTAGGHFSDVIYSPKTTEAEATVGNVDGMRHEHQELQETKYAPDTTDASSVQSICEQAFEKSEGGICKKIDALDIMSAQHFPGMYENYMEKCEGDLKRSLVNGTINMTPCVHSVVKSTDAHVDKARDMGGSKEGKERKGKDNDTFATWTEERRSLEEKLIIIAAERDMLMDQLRIYNTYDEAKQKRKKETQPQQTPSGTVS